MLVCGYRARCIVKESNLPKILLIMVVHKGRWRHVPAYIFT